jgi:hypothetical protein
LVGGVVADASQYVAEIGERIEFVSPGGGDEAEQHRGGRSAVVAAEKRPVVSPDGNRPHQTFGGIVVDVEIAVARVRLRSQ